MIWLPIKGWLLGFLALTTMALSACVSGVSKATLVLNYADFGPQAMAYKIIGRNQLPWAPNTPPVLGESQIRIVVYRGITKEEVEAAFRPNKHSHYDYRYVPYRSALNYLDNNIARNILAKVTLRLEATRNKIFNGLGVDHR